MPIVTKGKKTKVFKSVSAAKKAAKRIGGKLSYTKKKYSK
mgnify:CR=1 FL=1